MLQFRYQVLGIVVGAVLAVVFARLFMAAYPVLLLDQTVMKADQQPAEWSSAMTYKFVGVLRSLTDDKPFQRTAIGVGVRSAWRSRCCARSSSRAPLPAVRRQRPRGCATDFVLDAVRAAFALCAVVRRLRQPADVAVVRRRRRRRQRCWKRAAEREERARRATCREDMSSTSLFGGGLIAGDALAALGLGLAGLAALAR